MAIAAVLQGALPSLDWPPMMLPRTLAALATVPGREAHLLKCLESLRPQVEKIFLVCHDMLEPPAFARALVDRVVCEPDRKGSSAPIRWSHEHEGLYLKCDDDWIYPADYVATMLRWVKRWKGRAIVTCHGKALNPSAKRFQDASFGNSPLQKTEGRWLNYPGACAIAWDTRLKLPIVVPGKNLEESYFAIECQRRQIPIWLVPHEAGWLKWLLAESDLPTIWKHEKETKFVNRNAPILEYGASNLWKIHELR